MPVGALFVCPAPDCQVTGKFVMLMNVLVVVAAADARIAFFDDRAWFAQRWGGRDGEGQPAYRSLAFGPGLVVTLSQGDAPQHAVLADGHAVDVEAGQRAGRHPAQAQRRGVAAQRVVGCQRP